MKPALLVIAAVLPLAACGQSPTVSEENASVEEVAQKVRVATRDKGFVQPGKWSSTITIEDVQMPGAPPATAAQMKKMMMQTRTAESCLTPEEAKAPKGDFFGGSESCRYDHFKMGGGKIDAKMHCAQDKGSQVMEMSGSYSPTSYEMHMKSQVQGGEPGQAMTMQMRVESKRVGECDKPTT